MKDKTKKLLLSLGVMPNLRGFRFLGDAIDIYAERNGNISITKELYPAVAAMHSTERIRVERNIRSSICKLGDNMQMDEIIDILGAPPRGITGTYTNSEFIALCALKFEK